MLVTVVESIEIARRPEVVWDFTQDYSSRSTWDPSILRADVLEGPPLPRVRIEAAGGLKGVFQYKLFDRPKRTTLFLSDVKSPLFAGGGGSWSYEIAGEGTLWTRTDSLRFKSRLARWLLGPLVSWNMRRAARSAMANAKRALESGETR